MTSTRKETNDLVNRLKADGQDFEFYPTTQEMLDVVIKDFYGNCASRTWQQNFNVLDVGAGDCRLGKTLNDPNNEIIQSATGGDFSLGKMSNYYVIEKALAHIQNLNKHGFDCTLVGTNFFETDLSVIDATITFCNPPYSSYDFWIGSILASSRSAVIYAVIPARWKNNENIKRAIADRGYISEVIFEGDFLEADRKARAVVEVVRFVHPLCFIEESVRQNWGGKLFRLATIHKQAFDPLFESLNLFKDKSKDIGNYESERKKVEQEERGLKVIFEQDKLTGLVDSYNKELASITEDLQAVKKLSPRLLSLFDVDAEIITNKFREDLLNLKRKYWNIFFDCYDPITQRLTKESRNNIQQYLSEKSVLDFTYSNAQAVTIFAIESANTYIDDQIKHLFVKHANSDNLRCYKSNQRVLQKNAYRYCNVTFEDRDNAYSHTMLEYRLVVSYYPNSHWDRTYKAEQNQGVFSNIINDYVVIARTLGINIPTYNKGAFIEFGEKHEVLSSDGTVLFDIKFHKKGTYHIRLNQEFCLRLNIAIGRLFGWLHTADDLSELGEDIDPTHWDSLQHITPKTLALTFNGAVSDTEGDGDSDDERSVA